MARTSRRSNGEGTIYFDEVRQRWEGQLPVTGPDGRRRRRKVTGPTRSSVQKKLRELRRQIDAGATALDRTLTVSRFADIWVRDLLPVRDIRESTKRGYEYVCRHYVEPTWGSARLCDLRPVTIERGLHELAERGLSWDTVRHAKVVLGMLLVEAERNELIAKNPMPLVRMPRIERSSNRRAMNQEQVHALLAAVEGTRLYPIITVALTTGLRPGELLSLRWDDLMLDSARPSLRVVRAKTDKGRRVVELTGTAVDALRAQRRYVEHDRAEVGVAWRDEGWVFPTPIGTKTDISNFRKRFKAACVEAGIGDWTLHELRHTAASWLIGQKLPLKWISDTLGHSSVSVTADIYGHLIAPVDEVVCAFEALVARPETRDDDAA